MAYLRKQCHDCPNWTNKGVCNRIMHGLGCVLGPLPPREFSPEDVQDHAEFGRPGEIIGEYVARHTPPRIRAETKPTNPKDMIGIRKAPFSTVSGAVIAEVGTAMLEGAAKYGRHNYRVVGVRASVYYDATMRHLVGWWEGEDLDPDSGLSHVTKAIASLVVLRDAMINGKCEDDRPPVCAPFLPDLNVEAGKILDRHADKNPKHYTQAGIICDQIKASLRNTGLDDEHDALTFGERSGSIE